MKFLKNMKVKQRLIYSFLGAVATAVIAAVLGVVFLVLIDIQYSSAMSKYGFIQGDIGNFNAALSKGGEHTRDLMIYTEEAQVQAAYSALQEASEQASAYYSSIKAELELEEAKNLFFVIDAAHPQYVSGRDKAVELAMANQLEEAMEVYQREAVTYLEEIEEATAELMQLVQAKGDAVSALLSRVALILIIVICVIILIAVVGAVVFAIDTANDFSTQIGMVHEAARKLQKGELDIDVQMDSKNEIGDMAKEFNEGVAKIRTYIEAFEFGMGEVGNGNFTVQPPIEFEGDFVRMKNALINIMVSLSATMRQINEGSEQVAMGADQMAGNAQNLADGASSQAGAVEELTATIENVAIAAESSAKKADESYQEAEKYAKVAEDGSKEMGLLTEAMERITETSKEIESIIAEIEEIASQTNLLSLNASIEAARAGEAGRGFAVVADQIGKLAADSAQSAVNTRELIAKSLEEINKGNAITERTAEALAQVIEGVHHVAEASKENSEMSFQQAESMVQLQQGVEQIADVVSSNSAAAEETSATSEELAAQAQNLKALVEQFQLLDS